MWASKAQTYPIQPVEGMAQYRRPNSCLWANLGRAHANLGTAQPILNLYGMATALYDDERAHISTILTV